MTDGRTDDRGTIVWLTGLSGSGKSTIADALRRELIALGARVEVLDGDVMRQELCRDLGFSRADRGENIRRIGVVANLLARHGITVIVAAVSPYRDARDQVRRSARGRFVEVFVSAPVDVCESRDPKGLYHRARAGQLSQFTGIDDPYEPPVSPDVVCPTHTQSVEESVAAIANVLLRTTAAS